MKFLVIGGAGYVGSHFVAEAMRQGHQCYVYDNLSTGHEQAVLGCAELIRNDVRRQVPLAEAIDRIEPDVVLHYAASALVGESVIDPRKYYDNNVLGMKSVLEVLSRVKTKAALIFSSTCAVYGPGDGQPLDEHVFRQPTSPYGKSKLVCEFMIEDFCQAYGLKAMCLRYFNAAGADAIKNIGESHDPETHLIPILLDKALSGGVVEIFGQDYPTADGTCVRDYIHVTDLAEYHLRAADFLAKAASGTCEAVNLGTGIGWSNLQVVGAVKKVTAREVKFRMAPRRPGDPPALVAKADKALALFGYRPQHSDLEGIVASAMKWEETGF